MVLGGLVGRGGLGLWYGGGGHGSGPAGVGGLCGWVTALLGCQWPSGGARLSLHPGSSQRDPIPFPFSAGWSVGDPPPPPPPLPALTPHPRTPRLAPRPPGTMAQVGHRVDYLAGFCCPVGGLVAGKPRVLCHENEIYLSNGSEFVYVYDQEGKVLKVSGLVGLGGRGGFTPSPLCWDGALGLGAGVPGTGRRWWRCQSCSLSPVTQSRAGIPPSVSPPSTNELHELPQSPLPGSKAPSGSGGCCCLAPLLNLQDKHLIKLERLFSPPEQSDISFISHLQRVSLLSLL